MDQQKKGGSVGGGMLLSVLLGAVLVFFFGDEILPSDFVSRLKESGLSPRGRGPIAVKGFAWLLFSAIFGGSIGFAAGQFVQWVSKKLSQRSTR